MICDTCHKINATVHLTEIIDNQMTELHLCEDCARKKSVEMEQHFGLADLLAGLADFGKPMSETEGVALKCSNCDLTYSEFRKIGRLGCGECYKAFRVNLEPLLRKIHGSNQHVGKSPIQEQEKVVTKVVRTESNELAQLKQNLQKAIQAEEFEEAAKIRDKIRELEKKMKK